MKKRITRTATGLTIGVDLGDKRSEVCGLDQAGGDVLLRDNVPTSQAGLEKLFGSLPSSLVVLEVGTHSPWVSRLLTSLGHQVLVANARRVRLVYQNPSKSDRIDAESLARLARVDPKLLCPVQHRDENQQAHLAILRSRDALVRVRTQLVNHVRGSAKALGTRLSKCTVEVFPDKVGGQLPEELGVALNGVLQIITGLTKQIRQLEHTVQQVAREHYPEVATVMQIKGVGVLSAMRFTLTLQDPGRFRRNRAVGAFVGLTPRRDQSGRSDPQKRITKAGDSALRWTLMQCSHYILGPYGPDTDLKRFGKKLSERGGKNAKKRALVAVARRLAVLMLSLWKTGEVYEPLRHAQATVVPA
jgi:transposase